MRKDKERKVIVLLDGQGGDELLAGYVPYLGRYAVFHVCLFFCPDALNHVESARAVAFVFLVQFTFDEVLQVDAGGSVKCVQYFLSELNHPGRRYVRVIPHQVLIVIMPVVVVENPVFGIYLIPEGRPGVRGYNPHCGHIETQLADAWRVL